MKTDVRFDSDAATVAFLDGDDGFEARNRDAAEVLRGRVKTGAAFVVETDDPWLSSFHFYLDEPVPEEIEEAYTQRGGSFLLRLPS